MPPSHDAPSSSAAPPPSAGSVASAPRASTPSETAPPVRREAAFVALSLAGMLGGLAAGWTDAPPAVTAGAYAVSYMFGGWSGLVTGLRTLRQGRVDIDLLMILAAGGALAIGAPFEGAMLLFLFSLSNVLQHIALGRSRRAIEALLTLRPDEARIRADGTERMVPLAEVQMGDVFVLRPGDRVPLDGTVIDGEGTVNQAALTGESVPVLKESGTPVYGGTINETGHLAVRVTHTVHDSTLARLIRLVEEAQGRKAATQRLIDRLEQPYVLGVLGLTGAALSVPLLMGEAFEPAFYRAMTLMVAASPCAVVISTPAAVLSAIAVGARHGVLFKGGAHVEAVGSIRALAFDKTGTLTQGTPELTDVAVYPGAVWKGAPLSEERLLALAAAVQSGSEHHLAHATVRAASERNLDVPPADRFQAVVGRGVRAEVEGEPVHVGNAAYADALQAEAGDDILNLDAGREAVRALQEAGTTSVLVLGAVNGVLQVLGWMGFADALRPHAAGVVAALRRQGIAPIVLLTGDTAPIARRIGEAVGVDAVQAELLPAAKVAAVEQLVDRHGAVAMVGDGVNDAPALARATVGIAMGGAGTDVALEAADVVLMADDLQMLPYALDLGRRTRHTLRVNLAIAFGAIFLMIAAIFITGIPLPLAVVGHEGSTVLVSLNGLRLLAHHPARGAAEPSAYDSSPRSSIVA